MTASRADMTGRIALLGERLRSAFLKPAGPSPSPAPKPTRRQTVETLQASVRSADDKERLIGLLAAPVAAAIGLLVMGALIANDPPALLSNGQVNKLHVSLNVYYELTGVLVVLSVLMLVVAMLRKRLYLGILMALFGLAVFNLHYWGFGIPFLMAGSWLLVRSYRLQRELRDATGGKASAASRRGDGPAVAVPVASKRYTPPSAGKRPGRR